MRTAPRFIFTVAVMLAGLVGCDEPSAESVIEAPKPPKAAQPVTVVAPGAMPKSHAGPETSAAGDSEETTQLKAEVAALRQENALLRQQLLKLSPPAAASVPQAPFLPNKSGVPVTYTLPPEQLSARRDDFPSPGSELSRAEFNELMTGGVQFNPGSIPSSDRPVTEGTPLQIGQEVQLKWNGLWWAATVMGFEPDGTVRTSYFGWDRRFDEAVPRSDLQIDTNTREKAIQGSYRVQP
ncbi:MAG: hypothetical protein JNG86_07945 [Verrucomicrobiaceae bacterium]|nr:hypothetical protein [Verrucomicrobiaceae bacterium]